MEHLDRLKLFISVAKAGSFTKAAAQLGVSQSTLSYTIKALEQDLGIQLLHRNTRSLAPTLAGKKLLDDISPLMSALEDKITQLHTFCQQPQGNIRLAGSAWVFRHLLAEKLRAFRAEHPQVALEIHTEVRFQNIINEGFDAGIRLGELVEQDMIAQRISPDITMCLAASPAYLAARGIPKQIHDLAQHRCLMSRLPTLDNIMAWEFSHPSSQQIISHTPTETPLVSNNPDILQQAALAGEGLIWMPEYVLSELLAKQQLQAVLTDWVIRYQGYYLYYPSRNASSSVFQSLLQHLKA